MKRLLTLKDYNIQSGSFLNLSVRPIHLRQQQQNLQLQHQLEHQQHQQNQHVYMSTMSMANEYQVYASSSSSSAQPLLGGSGGKNNSTSAPLPLTPPPCLARFHLLKSSSPSPSPAPSSHNHHHFSTTASSTSGDTQSSSTVAPPPTNPKKSSGAKKYEKLLTVKSQDSAVTTASLIASEDSSSSSSSSSGASSPGGAGSAPSKTAILSRLLLNKGIVQPFIDQFIESVFMNTANLPPVVHHLFEFVDSEVRKFCPASDTNTKFLDELSRVTRTWKTHVLFVRYWSQLIRSPDILFDCKRTPLLDASLECIAQALVDACSSMDAHNLYDTDSPTNRLLFIREVPRYKLMMEQFLSDLKQTQSVSDHELHFYLNEFGKMHSSGMQDLGQVNALLKCYALYEKCESQCNQALGQQQCSILLPVHHRLVQIKDLMTGGTAKTTTTTATMANNSSGTLNPNYLSQLVAAAAAAASAAGNTYATASDVCISLQPQHLVSHFHNQQHHHHQHQQQQYF